MKKRQIIELLTYLQKNVMEDYNNADVQAPSRYIAMGEMVAFNAAIKIILSEKENNHEPNPSL